LIFPDGIGIPKEAILLAKKKVLFVATVVKTHIVQFHIPYLKMLKEMGWETAVAAKNDYDDPNECNIPYCDKYYPVAFGRSPLTRDNICAYKELKSIIDEGDFDMIHCHTPVAAFLTRLAARDARKKGCKVVYTAHGYHFYKGAPLLNWLVFFPAEWIASFFTDVLITINREDYKFSRKHLHAKRLEYVQGVGVKLERFQNHSAERDAIRASLGLGKDDFVLLSVAEMTKNKNHRMMLEAMARIPNPHVHLLCAGRGQELENNIALCSQLHLMHRVHFLGYRSDVPQLYAAADVFLFISFREGLSLSLMEAMSSGLPCIVSPIRGNVDLITDRKEGLYAHLHPKSIAEAIVSLESDPELRRTLGEAAKEKVQAFSLDTISKRMEDIYRSISE